MKDVEATRRDGLITVVKFLFTNLITRYGYLLELVNDRGTYFLNEVIEGLTNHF